MIRCGRFAEARALALQTARRLSEADGVASRAWRTASQASYFLCKNRDSLNFALEARRLAITPEEAEEAVAQAVSAAADLEATETNDLISALEDANPRTPEGRLRLAQRRVQAAARTGSLAGMEAVLRATQPMQALARDPYVKSGFAACQAYVQYARAAYNVATRLALELERYCTEYRLGFAACVCRLAVARAAAGARDFTAAHAALAEAKSQLDADQDAFNHVAYTCSLMEVLLAEKDVEQAQALDLTTESVAAPASIVGEFYALRALAHAVAANSNAARRDVATANEFTQGLEASRYADFAQAILSLSQGDRDPAQAQQRILQSIHATASADFAHAFVLAARLRPDLLAVVEGNRPARRFAVDAFMRSGDTTFAAALEPGLHRAKNRIGSYTARDPSTGATR